MTKTQLRAYAQRAALGDVTESDGDLLLGASGSAPRATPSGRARASCQFQERGSQRRSASAASTSQEPGAGRGCCSGARRRGVRSGWRREGPFELYRRPLARAFVRRRSSSRRLAHARLAWPPREAPSGATVASRTAPAHQDPPVPVARAPARRARAAPLRPDRGRRPEAGIERRASARHATRRRIRIAKHCGDQRALPDTRRRETEDRRPPAAGRAPAVTNAPGRDS